jgi:hypothetical protein
MIALDPKTTALVLIDLQKGILGRKLKPISADDLIVRGNALAGTFRAEGALVALVSVAPVAEEPPRQVDDATTSIALESHANSMRRIFPRIARVSDSDALAFLPA